MLMTKPCQCTGPSGEGPAAHGVLGTQVLLVEVTFWLMFFVVLPAVTGTTLAEP
jgi:hypothetical protein